MKCTECPEYTECHMKNNLTIKRKTCPKARMEKVVTNADRIRAQIKTDESLAKQIAKHIPTHAMPKEVREIWFSARMSPEEAWLRWLQLPAKK